MAYRIYENDKAKAKTYNHRLRIADGAFDKWKGAAEDWWSRYENAPKRSQVTPKGHVVNVPTGVATIDALFSALTAIDVEFVVDALAGALPGQEQVAEAGLNREWLLNHVTEETFDSIKDALVSSIGFAKVSYDFFSEVETKDVQRELKDIKAEVAALIKEAAEAGSDLTPLEIEERVPTVERVTTERIIRDHIVVDYVPWDMVRYDASAKRWRDVRWVAQYTKMPLRDVKENPVWREYVKRSNGGLAKLDKLKADSTIDKELLVNGHVEPDDELVTVVEFTDLETGTVCTFVKNQDWLLFESVNPFAMGTRMMDRSPFVPLVLRGSTRRIRGIGDMELIVRSLDEKNIYRSRLANFIDRFVPKVMGPEDALTEEGKEALSNTEYGAYVSFDRQYVGSEVVKPISPPVLPSEAFDMPNRIDDEIRDATGVNELMRGLFPDRKRTATETSEVVSASAARQSEKRNVLELFYIEIGRRILCLMQQFYEQARMVRMVDPTLGNIPWEFTADDIIMEYDLRVHLSPREAKTRQSERDEALTALNVLGPFTDAPQGGAAVIDKATFVAWFMRKYGFARRDIVELLNLPEEQQVQKMDQLQMTAAMAQAAGTGVANPAMVSGPLSPDELAAVTNVGAVPPEVAAGAVGGIGPGAPEAVEAVSESAGVRV